jgi:hypothetical protein
MQARTGASALILKIAFDLTIRSAVEATKVFEFISKTFRPAKNLSAWDESGR